MIKIDATLCEHLIDFRKFTEQEFGGSFPSFVTFMDHSPASSRFFANQARAMLCFALFLLYLNLTIEIYEMGHSCLVGVLEQDKQAGQGNVTVHCANHLPIPCYISPFRYISPFLPNFQSLNRADACRCAARVAPSPRGPPRSPAPLMGRCVPPPLAPSVILNVTICLYF